MKNLEKAKMIIGYTLIGFSIIGMLVAFSYQFDWDWFKYDYKTFGRGDEGGASNSPIFYGLMAIAGSILLATVKNEENNQCQIESKESEK
jgi:hypothetical protein